MFSISCTTKEERKSGLAAEVGDRTSGWKAFSADLQQEKHNSATQWCLDDEYREWLMMISLN